MVFGYELSLPYIT